MSTPRLMRTTDYDLFEMHEFNRPLHNDSVLLTSMKKNGFLPQWPISCERNGSGKLKIIAGHHRFAYAKRLGLPVYYIADHTHVDICDIEGSKKSSWSTKDHIIARAAAGDPNYQLILDFAKEHSLPLTATVSLVGGEGALSHNKMPQVIRGRFRAGDLSFANEVVDITDHCRKAGIGFATHAAFVGAVSAVLRVPEFEPRRFKDRVSTHPGHMIKRGTVDEYLEEIDSLYNYTTRIEKRVPLLFRAKEVGLIRQRSFGKES